MALHLINRLAAPAGQISKTPVVFSPVCKNEPCLVEPGLPAWQTTIRELCYMPAQTFVKYRCKAMREKGYCYKKHQH